MLRLIATLLVAATLTLSAAASAQTTIRQDGADMSTQPPVQLDLGSYEQADRALPNTGTDPRLLLLAGLALTLLVGLRLRTADADVY